MNPLYKIFVDPFMQMGAAPDLFVQTLWEGLVSGVLYSLVALGFVLIYKASGVFNFAQGIMVVFAGLTLVGLYERGIPAFAGIFTHQPGHGRAGSRDGTDDAAAAGEPTRNHPVHGYLRPVLAAHRNRGTDLRRQPKVMISDQFYCRAAPSISRSWAASCNSRSSISRRRVHRLGNGGDPSAVLPVHPDRPGVACRGR